MHQLGKFRFLVAGLLVAATLLAAAWAYDRQRSPINVGQAVPESHSVPAAQIMSEEPNEPNVTISHYSPKSKLVIFPKHFPVLNSDLEEFYQNHFDDSRGWKVFKFNDGSWRNSDPLRDVDLAAVEYKKYAMEIFDSFQEPQSESSCDNTKQRVEVDVADSRPSPGDIETIVKRVFEARGDYVDELKKYFAEDYPKQVAQKAIKKHWLRLATTSVWLERYGVHFMVSRIIYTPNGQKNSPLLSFTYTQLFNDQWVELDNTRLIIPTNQPDMLNDQVQVDGVYLRMLQYPSVMPVPFFHDPERRDGRNYGPEDPRLLLVKNALGYEEPVMVYNSFHRKIVQQTSANKDEDVNLKVKYYRSMWMCWPWQFQRGKRNVDDLATNYDSALYNKVAELRRSGLERSKLQKNWTPFVDHSERVGYNFDRNIYFIYRWTDLEIMKCNLVDIMEGRASCSFVYRMDAELAEDKAVGDFRGGTELLSVNQLVDDSRIAPNEGIQKFLKDRQVWLGFARAHLEGCGCSRNMYRPNFVMVTKENGIYKVDKVSSFLSLNVQMIAWDEGSTDLCKSHSVFIPNGVGSWSLDEAGQDYLTLSFSLSDASNDMVQIRGLLQGLVDQDRRAHTGYNNYNVECALEGSKQFCKAFGLANKNHS